VRSTPAGARVFVDGRDRGQAPATLTDLGQGEHRVRLVQEGYLTAERRVVLSAERPAQVLTVPLAKKADVGPKQAAPAKPDLVAPKPGSTQPAKADASPKPGSIQEAEAGTIVLDSRPTGATAFVDGKAVGKTPVTVPGVKAGDHTVRFELAGHHP